MNAKKYLYIADMSGKAQTYLEYQGYPLYQMCDDGKKCMIAKSMSKEEVTENMRKNFAVCMDKNFYCAWNVDTMCPNYKGYSSDKFPVETVFDREKWVANETYKSILTPKEDQHQGN